MAEQVDQQEQEQIVQIAMNYFRQEAGSEEGANKMMASLAKIVEEDGAKLVHLGNVLFLVLVRGKGVVEVHTIGTENPPLKLAKDFKQLTAYLKNIGVKMAYTYTTEDRFGRLAQMTGLPFKKFKVKVKNKPMNVYVMEF